MKAALRKSLPVVIPLSTYAWIYSTQYPSYTGAPYFNVIADDKHNEEDIDEFVANYKQWIYPYKADAAEVGKFLNFLEMLPRHKNVLIIGSNPLLRDKAFLTEKNVTCCDYSEYKMKSMKRHMKYARYIDNETWIKRDENHHIDSDQQYDYILSIDCDLNTLSFDEWDTFLTEIFAKLKDNGFFILKTVNKSNDDLFSMYTSAEQIVEDWAYSQYKSDLGYLFIHLLIYLYHKNEENNVNCVKISDVIELVSERCDIHKWEWSKKQKTDFFEKFNYFAQKDPNKDVVFYCKTEKETKTLLANSTTSKLFYIQQTCYGKDDEDKYKFTPIYVLGKQSNRTGGQPKVWGHATDDT